MVKNRGFSFLPLLSIYVRFSKMLKWLISKEQQTAPNSRNKLIYKTIFLSRKLAESQLPHSILPEYACPPHHTPAPGINSSPSRAGESLGSVLSRDCLQL